jgi:hypothetical protein
MFSTKWLDYIITRGSDININNFLPGQEKEIAMKALEFASALQMFKETNINKLIKKLPDTTTQDMDPHIDKELHLADAVVTRVRKGFVGSPIYKIRMQSVDFFIESLNRKKLEKTQLELKLAALKQAVTGEVDLKLEKQIKYYSNQINKIDYSINKMMSGLG